uniref:proline-rich receptor-like protein kinase PERK1 n=1 Tax=Erigeron canadensis TaxID=72917 RepID=UPI001CB912D3|nr:proline-rich receptor-like protein kinase PERK1 [Erigeron canadensis]
MSSPPPATSPPTNTTTSPPPAPTTTTPSAPPPSSSPPPSQPPPSSPPPTPPVTSPPPPVTLPPSISPPAPPPPSGSTPLPPSTSPPASPSPPPPSGSTPSTPPSGSPPSPPASTSPPPPTPSRNSPPAGRNTPSPPPPPPRSVSSGPPAVMSPPSDGGGISTGAVVGIAVAAVFILGFFSILFICCKKRKRRTTHDPPSNYYIPPPPKVDSYGGGQQQWQNNVPPPGDHVVMIPPVKPPLMGTRPQQSPARSQSPQPPPFSSGGSGSNYSAGSNGVPPLTPGLSLGFSKSTFSYEELAMATDGFSESNVLGQGGFGYVYKGVLPNGKEVAVKSLKAGSGQGEREFQAEVEIISRVHHKHLVSLVGYCISGDQRMLVYEFVPNNTLEFHLHGKNRPVMEFATRMRIALGSAKGLAYLHEDCHPKIIHRDIKAANILIDYNFEAKVADFGLAKITSDVATHVSTRVMGTFGYLAPEYASSGKLSEKSDVFSYGVMLLELITGRRPVDSANAFMDDSLVDWARPLLTRALEDGNLNAIVDPRLRDYNQTEMARMVSCAAVCVRHSARRRPKMSQVVRALEDDVSLADLDEGIKPGHSSVYSESSDYDTAQYNKDMVKFRKMALGTQEYATGEFSQPTSEYGLNPSGSSSEGRNTREMEMGRLRKDSGGYSDGF